MRKRSGALHCQSAEEFAELAEQTYNNMGIFYDSPDKFQKNKSNKSSFSRLQEHSCSNLEEKELRETPYELHYTYDLKCIIIGQLDCETIKDLYHPFQSQFFKDNQQSQYQQEEQEFIPQKNRRDLITQNEDLSECQEILYKLWMVNLNIPSNQLLLELVDYNSVDYGILLYNAQSKQSVEQLSQYLQELNKLGDIKNIKLYLIGIEQSQDIKQKLDSEVEKQVSQLKQQYCIQETQIFTKQYFHCQFKELLHNLKMESGIQNKIDHDHQTFISNTQLHNNNNISTQNSTPNLDFINCDNNMNEYIIDHYVSHSSSSNNNQQQQENISLNNNNITDNIFNNNDHPQYQNTDNNNNEN